MQTAPSAIPKIIHQTWKTSEVPEEWRRCVQSWRDMHPDWDVRLWTDEDNRNFVATEYPEILEVYDAYSYGIQRADAIRYLLLHHFGGVYVDLDLECIQPFDELLVDKQFFIGKEPQDHADYMEEQVMVCNACMGSVAGHPFLEALIQGMQQQPKILTHDDVLSSTGPIMVSRVYEQYTGEAISLLEDSAFYPLNSKDERLGLMLHEQQGHEDVRAELIAQGSYAVHYWDNSWGRNLAGVLENPNPHEVEGYRFYPRQDSFGNDLFNAGRNIAEVAELCSQHDEAVAFNTHGFVKSALRPRKHWDALDGVGANEGLYVKEGAHIPSPLGFYLSGLFKRVLLKLGFKANTSL